MENKNKKMDIKECLVLKEYGKRFFFWYSFDRIEFLLTPNEHISDKFSLSILARAWIFHMIKRNTFRIGVFNNQILYPYLKYNLLFNKKQAIKETLKVYAKVFGFVLLNISYLSIIIYYDTYLYDQVMNHWFVEYVTPKYIINK